MCEPFVIHTKKKIWDPHAILSPFSSLSPFFFTLAEVVTESTGAATTACGRRRRHVGEYGRAAVPVQPGRAVPLKL